MKRYIYTLFLGLAIAGFTSCSDDDKLPDIKPTDKGTVTDNDGNIYEWVRIGDQLWTTSNAKNGEDLSEKQYYNNFSYKYVLSTDEMVEYYVNEYFPVKGNLMSYEDALASAPEGWRLPTDEDWMKLEKTLGISNPEEYGFRGDGVAFALTSKDEGAQLGLLFGGACIPEKHYGCIEIEFNYENEHGYYWTATTSDKYETDNVMAYYRRVTANYGKVSRGCMRADCYMSVRWVKDA